MLSPPIPEGPPPLIMPGNPPKPPIPPIGFKGAEPAGDADEEELAGVGAGPSAFF
jgi:hypothetical protein